MFCLLALHNARDWRRGEDIRLQELHDHHIFPQAYLRRHDVTRRVDVNSVANRTLISNETNTRIKDKAPADYIGDPAIFPTGAIPGLMAPHFIGQASLTLMREATEAAAFPEAADICQRFLQAREAAMIAEIRRACGITAAVGVFAQETVPDDAAGDMQAGTDPQDDQELGEELLA